MVAITGNTYPVKEELKALGAKWNAPKKAWMVSEDVADEARALVAGAPVRAYQRQSRYQSGRGWTSSGAYIVSRGGRCEDAPCCGCCD